MLSGFRMFFWKFGSKQLTTMSAASTRPIGMAICGFVIVRVVLEREEERHRRDEEAGCAASR